MKTKQLIMICLAAFLLFVGCGQPVEAAEQQSATIDEVIGTVWVKKAGGQLSVRAYPEMQLGQGDIVTTESFSSIKLRLENTQDELTISSNASLQFTDLRTEGASELRDSPFGRELSCQVSIQTEIRMLFLK